MNVRNAAPDGVQVRFRRMAFAFDGDMPRHWYRDSPFLTHFFNALSAIFPSGERYFIETMRKFEGQISDPGLRARARGFMRQEGHHGHHHDAFNRSLAGTGVSIARCQAVAEARIHYCRTRHSELRQLANTCALEHFTALMSDWLLRGARAEDIHPSVRPLWLWHAAEETEHKAVAFDVYEAAGGDYLTRAWAMLFMTVDFFPRVHHMQCLLMREDPTAISLKDVFTGLAYLYGRNGLLRNLARNYFAYYRRDFHPWQHDNSALIQRWLEMQATSPAPTGT